VQRELIRTHAFRPAVRLAAGLLTACCLLGDAGYGAQHNHHLCRHLCHEVLGIAETLLALNPQSRGWRSLLTPYQRAMRQYRILAGVMSFRCSTLDACMAVLYS
jgi:hypothetical protein